MTNKELEKVVKKLEERVEVLEDKKSNTTATTSIYEIMKGNK